MYIYYNNYIEQKLILFNMLSVIIKKNYIKNALKWIFSSLSIFFITMLVVITVHDTLIGRGDTTPIAELCAKYGAFASPECR